MSSIWADQWRPLRVFILLAWLEYRMTRNTSWFQSYSIIGAKMFLIIMDGIQVHDWWRFHWLPG